MCEQRSVDDCSILDAKRGWMYPPSVCVFLTLHCLHRIGMGSEPTINRMQYTLCLFYGSLNSVLAQWRPCVHSKFITVDSCHC